MAFNIHKISLNFTKEVNSTLSVLYVKKVRKRNNLPKNTQQVNSRTETRTRLPCGISHQLGPGNVLCFHREPTELQPLSEPEENSLQLL